MDEKIDNDIEVEINQNIMSNNKRNIKKRITNNNNNFGALTREQFELMKKIREETLSRTERYSELIAGNKSNDEFIATENNKKKKLKLEKENNNEIIEQNINKNKDSLDIGEFTSKNKENEEIDSNKERIFKIVQPFLFYKGEPLILIGPDSRYYVWIFSLVSFLCIIIYSLKNSYLFLKIIFIFSYLLFAILYTLLLVKNPGIPANKKNLDITMSQNEYRQCSDCNCITMEKNGKDRKSTRLNSSH